MGQQFEQAGARITNKEPKFTSIYMENVFEGLFTQRSILHDPASIVDRRFYGGKPAAIWDGLNTEITNNLTLARRPGTSAFSEAIYPTPPLRAFSFELQDGTIQVLVDTGSTPTFNLSVVDEISGVAFYHFTTTQPTAANNAYVGLAFQVQGFDLGPNNGTFICTSSTSSYLILTNPLAQTDTSSATAVSAGAVYYDQQNNGPSYSLSAVDEISGVAYYQFSAPQSAAANNGFINDLFSATGFDHSLNNGIFECAASTQNYVILNNPQAVTDVHSGTLTSTDKVLLFPKSPTAGQTYFVAVAGICYMGDGVDTRKYTPGNPNGIIWNWGIEAPTEQPTMILTPSGAAATAWQAATVFSTMGLLVDNNGNAQQLTSVNADGSNPISRFGTAGSGQPAFSSTVGGTVSDGGVTWTCQGAITTWTPNTLYQSGQPIYDPGTNGIWITTHSYAVTSGSTYPNFVATLLIPTNGGKGARVTEQSGARWGFLGTVGGSPSCVQPWTSGAVFNQYIQPSSGNDPNALNSATVEPTNIFPAPPGQSIFLQGATTNGTTTTHSNPLWGTVAGQTTTDNQLLWTCMGSATWTADTIFTAWGNQGLPFSVIKDANSNLQVCTTGGVSAAIIPGTAYVLSAAANAVGGNTTYTGTFGTNPPAGSTITIAGFATHTSNNGIFKVISNTPTTLVVNNPGGIAESHAATATYNPWGTGYGATTVDGTTTWTNVGASVSWTASLPWFLPVSGFQPPSQLVPFGGASIVESGVEQFVTSSGESGGSTPSWGALGSPTTDNGITWFAANNASANSLSWTSGYVYSFSYKSRMANDFYVTNAPPGVGTALGAPTGSGTGAISTASPVFTIIGANGGSVNTVGGIGSLDPGVDTVVLWRSADGGSSNSMFELTEIPNPSPVGGQPGTWSFNDFLPDIPKTINSISYPGLNNLIPAPINDQNDPPQPNFRPMCFNFERIWGSGGEGWQQVLFSGGPDIVNNGNPQECFNPADEFPYLAGVVSAIKTPQGLAVFTTDSLEYIAGGPSTASFFSVTLAESVGLGSYNALDQTAGEIYFQSSAGQFLILSPSLNLANAGFAIGDKLAALNPANVQVAYQSAGTDQALYVGDGISGFFRLNPYQTGSGSAGIGPVWSTFSLINGGNISMVQSVETTPGIKTLLIGSSTGGQPLLKRDLTVSTDLINGVATPYDAWAWIGAIKLANRGQISVCRFVEADFTGAGQTPSMSFLINEISGNFTEMFNPHFDPPQQYGTQFSPSSYSPLRWYFAEQPVLARAIFLSLEVDFGAINFPSEMLNLTINGCLMTE